MRLVLVQQHSGSDYFLCSVCGKWHPVADTLADLDGPAFKAYIGKGECETLYRANPGAYRGE